MLSGKADPSNRPTTATTRPIPEWVRCLIATPEIFAGDTESCKGFVVHCELYLGYQRLLPDHAKVAFVISRLTGRAHASGAALVVNSSPLLNDYPEFIGELKDIFHHPRQGRVAMLNELVHLAITYDRLLQVVFTEARRVKRSG
uniref:DUF4939 domain-containing protein n=1 Tax=Electrophorus electricus TaxID=8005 RepID=A0AAY5EKC5_ELEEL